MVLNIDSLIARLQADQGYRERFFGTVFADLLLQRLEGLKSRVAQLEAGGADGALTKQLAEARARITELEGQVGTRDENQEGEDEHLPFWDLVTAEIERLPKQTVAALGDETDKLLRHRAGGIFSAHLRGEFNRTEFRKRLKDQLQEIAQGKAVPAVRRTSPTPAPAGVSSSGREPGPMD